jgi:hypothetical protein
MQAFIICSYIFFVDLSSTLGGKLRGEMPVGLAPLACITSGVSNPDTDVSVASLVKEFKVNPTEAMVRSVDPVRNFVMPSTRWICTNGLDRWGKFQECRRVWSAIPISWHKP